VGLLEALVCRRFLVEERVDARLAKVYEAADAELSRGAHLIETARRFVSMLHDERDAMLLLVDFWNQAVGAIRPPLPGSQNATHASGP
jgi:hypothetical protein